MPSALVTGIGGQDGYYLGKLLLDEGYRVTGTIRPGARSPRLGVTILEAEMSVPDDLRRAIDIAQPDEVYNLAGVSSLAQADADPETCFAVNATAPIALLEMLGEGVRFCQASSALIYGPPDGTTRNEISPLAPEGPYAMAKAEVHRAIGEVRTSGRYAVSAVLFNHESPLRSTRFVSRRVTKQVAEIRSGTRDGLDVDNLGSTRDWGFAGDHVRAMWLALQQDDAHDFVIATGEAHSVRDLVEAAFGAAGIPDWEGLVRARSDRPEPWSPADPSRARDMLGWAPEVGFSELIAMMVHHDLGSV